MFSRKYIAIIILLVFLFLLGFAYTKNTSQSIVPRPSQSIPIAPVTNKDHIRGNTHAKVIIIEYSDFECPSCIYFQPTIKQILDTYGDKVRWVVRFYPLPQHAHAEKEAEAADCVNDLKGSDAFWKFSDLVFKNVNITEDGTGLALEKLPEFAKAVGVDEQAFSKCLNNGVMYDKVQQSIAEAQHTGINQLPSTIIMNDREESQLVISNQPFEVYKNIIDEELGNRE